MPLALEISHIILKELAELRREGKEVDYLRPDAKSQVTIEYSEDHKPIKVETIVISTQHDDFSESDRIMLDKIRHDLEKILMPRVIAKLDADVQKLFGDDINYHINPTGKFVIGGPHGDAGLTGRKIIVDTYGGKGAHGGGAFSGKDSTKVDRSAAYAARYVAKNLVASGVAQRCSVSLAYAIGVAEPTAVIINTFGTGIIKDKDIVGLVRKHFELTPKNIIESLELRRPIFRQTAAYGHFGRTEPEFTWEKTDLAEDIAKSAGI